MRLHRPIVDGFLAGRLLLVAILLAPAAAQEPPPDAAPRPRALILQSTAAADAAPAAGSAAAVLRTHGFADARGIAIDAARRPDFDAADVIVVDAPLGAAPDMAAIGARLLEAVRAGKGLVAMEPAAAAPHLAPELAVLLGRAERIAAPPPAADGAPAPDAEAARLWVAVLDQKHPVTQCLPHFVHDGGLDYMTLSSSARVLAAGARAWAAPETADELRGAPLIWYTTHGRGRVFACRLAAGAGASRALVELVVARAAQWASRDPVTLPLAAGAEFRLLAEALPAAASGVLRGGAAVAGYFRGRELAPFMTFHGAEWLVRPERESEEKATRVLDLLRLPAGATVVDLGAGNGYFSLPLARLVGPTGAVLAVDIQEEMLALLTRRAAREGAANIRAILGDEKDPKLPENAVDLVLFVDVYHELGFPREVLAAVRRSLKEKGRVVLVEYRGEDPAVPILPLHRMLERQARAELESLGFRWIETDASLPRQHFMVFERTAGP